MYPTPIKSIIGVFYLLLTKNHYFYKMTEVGYFLKQDLLSQLDADTLDELTGGKKAIGDNPAVAGSDLIWRANVPNSIELIKGYTRHWYDMETETRPFYEYIVTDAFTLGDRVASVEVDEVRTLFLCIQDAPAGTLLTNTDFFELKDDRNSVLIEIVAILVVYNTSRRKNPRQLPEQRQIDYENSINTLKDIQRGRIQLEIAQRSEVAADDPGQEVSYGEFEGTTQDNY